MKYNNKPVWIDGYRFASGHEGMRYRELVLLQNAHMITDLKIHTRHTLEINGYVICHYSDDFNYVPMGSGVRVYEDTKGFRTPDFVIKKKLMLALLGIDVQEIKMGKAARNFARLVGLPPKKKTSPRRAAVRRGVRG